MSRHDGVSCDSCLKGNFRGRRFKCLICYDYDLCSSCYENPGTTNLSNSSGNSSRHSRDHAMQCILTRSDHELFFGGDSSNEFSHSYACPFCSKLGFTEASLLSHVSGSHASSGSSREVVCPICASLPGGNPNNVTDDFQCHLSVEHRGGSNRELISFLDEPSNSGTSSSRASGVRRSVQHASRGAGSNGRTRRTANFHSSAAAAAAAAAAAVVTTSPGGNTDPIAELLSQLSGVRRSTTSTTNSSAQQFQQLQLQLQFERNQQTRGNSSVAAAAVAAARVRASSHGVIGGSSPNVETSTSNTLSNVKSAETKDSNHLYLLRNSSEDEISDCETENINKSLFVQELVLSSLLMSNEGSS